MIWTSIDSLRWNPRFTHLITFSLQAFFFILRFNFIDALDRQQFLWQDRARLVNKRFHPRSNCSYAKWDTLPVPPARRLNGDNNDAMAGGNNDSIVVEPIIAANVVRDQVTVDGWSILFPKQPMKTTTKRPKRERIVMMLVVCSRHIWTNLRLFAPCGMVGTCESWMESGNTSIVLAQ